MIKTILGAAVISGIAAVSFAGSAEARGFGGYHGGYHHGFHGGYGHFGGYHHGWKFRRFGF